MYDVIFDVIVSIFRITCDPSRNAVVEPVGPVPGTFKSFLVMIRTSSEITCYYQLVHQALTPDFY